ncbi:hypothetical protein MHBO_003202 [Bonamia ostreae]|uniref:Uncharacterized protein n=1 Tax=Bonamia ostreae TaxID=126728 RepID=A0ABV2APR5_9EUKA
MLDFKKENISNKIAEDLSFFLFINLIDEIPSLQENAATTISKLVKVHERTCRLKCINTLKEYLKFVIKISDDDQMSSDSEHFDQTLYSCGSLGPKLKKGKNVNFEERKNKILNDKSSYWRISVGAIFLFFRMEFDYNSNFADFKYLHQILMKIV